MSDTTTTTTTRGEAAPTLPELRETLLASLQAYPALRRGLAHALAEIEALADATQRAAPALRAGQRHNRRRYGLR